MITRQFGIPVTSPGAILRREKDLGTPLGEKTAEVIQHGGLVSDEIIVELIEDWLRLHGGHGFVFDGFPRTLPQAESLMSILTRLRSAKGLFVPYLCGVVDVALVFVVLHLLGLPHGLDPDQVRTWAEVLVK